MDQYARIISKKGSGVPTIPASNDHRNGDWLATDVYEGEVYLDTDTGLVYTRNGSSIITVNGQTPPTSVYKAIITQSGTSAPVASELINTFATATWGYTSPGIYTLTITGVSLPAANLIFISISPNNTYGEEIKITRTSTTVFTVTAYDNTGTPANSLFSSTEPVSLLIECY